VHASCRASAPACPQTDSLDASPAATRGFNASSRAKALSSWRLALRPPELGWLWLVSGRDRSLVSLLCPRPRPPRLRWTLATAGNGCREQTDRNNGDADAPGSPGLDFTTLMPACHAAPPPCHAVPSAVRGKPTGGLVW